MKEKTPSDGDALRSLLAARDERAWLQRFLLRALPGRGGEADDGLAGFVVQISLNIPGWPKRLAGDEFALREGEKSLTKTVSALDAKQAVRTLLLNAAGPALVYLFVSAAPESPWRVKKSAALIEDSAEWGRVLDIDVVTAGGPICRNCVGLPPRRCLMCDRDAKICARTARHPMSELRARAEFLMRPLREGR